MPRTLGDLIGELRGGYTNARNYLGNNFMSTGGPPGDPRATGLHEAFSGNLAGTLYPYLGPTGTRAAVDTAGFVNELVGGGSEFAGGRPFFSDAGFDWSDIGANYRGTETGMAPFAPTGITRAADDYLPPTRSGTQDFATTGGDPSLPTFGTENLPVLPVDPRFATTDPNNPLNQVAGPATTGTQSNPTLDRTRQQAGMGSNAAGQQIDPVASRDAAYQSAVDDVLGVSGADPNIPFRSAGERQGGGRPAGATPAPAASAPAPAPMQGGGTGRTANLANAGAPVAMQSASQQYTPGSLGAILAARGTRGRIFT